MPTLTSRQRLQAVLDHKIPDRLCVDFGAGGQTGMGVCAVHRLRQAVLGEPDYRVKVIEPYQMLGEIDEPLRLALGLDVVGVHSRCNMFGFENTGWKPFRMPADGTEVLVPERFNWMTDAKGDLLMYPQGDTTVPPCAKMPKHSWFWDSIRRQEPIVEEKLDWRDNCEEFGLLSEADIAHFKRQVDWYYENTDAGIYLTFPGLAFGDIALVPAPWLKHPRGIRDVEEWYVSTITRRDYVYKVFEYQCEIGLKNIERLAAALGDKVQVVFVSGTDFGTQRGPFISPQMYRDLYKPFQKAVNDKIHKLTKWKIFIHSCGSIYPLIPDLIEAGFDVLNPVQCSAADMDPARLKNEFGDQLVFWGGGVDTQQTLPFGTPEEVYRQVRERIDIFSRNGGYVFNSIHNVQSNVPTENLLAMFLAIDDARK
ncbi:MAG TPA: uroporphyrinogen decarboxylase family protein [Anaerohalosphaeraceae bacterium]|nr:uroporphyrinogen decarboxylase family protein [Anaerohalosphaeraceae bacterium]HOL88876.1 uroporphyrinogen decarboxylase family protein [Anaerohalosphaeraceae bacterium]HPP55718.1 uroporphyrinogen decarboxylase family protein [Anaerohalosphaeraceae bacterium]